MHLGPRGQQGPPAGQKSSDDGPTLIHPYSFRPFTSAQDGWSLNLVGCAADRAVVDGRGVAVGRPPRRPQILQ